MSPQQIDSLQCIDPRNLTHEGPWRVQELMRLCGGLPSSHFGLVPLIIITEYGLGGQDNSRHLRVERNHLKGP